MLEPKRERVEAEDATDRCQGAVTNGQCPMRAEPGDKFCHTHGGVDKARPAASRRYDLRDAETARRFAQMNTPEEIYNLRDEITLCRVLLERRFNMIDDDASLILASPALNQTMLTLERLIKSSTDIEHRLHHQLSKDALVMLCQRIVTMLVDTLEGIPNYAETVDKISTGIAALLEDVTNPEDSE